MTKFVYETITVDDFGREFVEEFEDIFYDEEDIAELEAAAEADTRTYEDEIMGY